MVSRLATLTTCLFALFTQSPAAMAQQPTQFQYRSVWLQGGDKVEEIQRTADWYKGVFGMLETRRFGTGQGISLGISMNFGRTPDEARAAPIPSMGIARSFPGVPGGPGKDGLARVAFNVTDLDAVTARAAAYGGSVQTPVANRNNLRSATIADPAGNLVELVEQKSASAPASWRLIRIPALDAAKTAAFYGKVLGMSEVSRSGAGTNAEVIVNFGATPAFAKANSAVPLAIVTVSKMPRPTLTVRASQVAIGFNGGFASLSDALKRAYAEGGRFVTEPHFNVSSQATYTRFVDPDGNFVELTGKCTAAEVSGDLGQFICG